MIDNEVLKQEKKIRYNCLNDFTSTLCLLTQFLIEFTTLELLQFLSYNVFKKVFSV